MYYIVLICNIFVTGLFCLVDCDNKILYWDQRCCHLDLFPPVTFLALRAGCELRTQTNFLCLTVTGVRCVVGQDVCNSLGAASDVCRQSLRPGSKFHINYCGIFKNCHHYYNPSTSFRWAGEVSCEGRNCGSVARDWPCAIRELALIF